jgi:hypothetical protein
MERVIKRFLLHNQNDFDDPKQNEYDEFKQDLQLLRCEIINNLKKSREETNRNLLAINTGIELVTEEVAMNDFSKSSNNLFNRYKELLNTYEMNSSRVNSEQEISTEVSTIIPIEQLDEIEKHSNKSDLKNLYGPEIDKIEVSST